MVRRIRCKPAGEQRGKRSAAPGARMHAVGDSVDLVLREQVLGHRAMLRGDPVAVMAKKLNQNNLYTYPPPPTSPRVT